MLCFLFVLEDAEETEEQKYIDDLFKKGGEEEFEREKKREAERKQMEMGKQQNNEKYPKEHREEVLNKMGIRDED